MTVSLRYVARSDVGLVRDVNQDSGYAGPDLLVLADGMGGAAGGDIASSVAVAHLAPLDGESHRSEDLLDRLRTALGNAHRDLVAYSAEQADLQGLGTTVIALLRSGTRLGMVHIGDSRAYLLRDEHLTQVTTDHTYVQHLIDTGELTEAEAEAHPQRSALLRVLGDGEAAPVVDESIREARAGDRWLLCSDGLSGMVSAETIERILIETADLDACADELVNLALRAGGSDNITVVVADVVETKDLPDTSPQVVGAAATDRARPTRGGGGASSRAAALTRPVGTDDDATARPVRRRRRVLTWAIAAVVVLGLLAGLGTLGYRWTQTQYYVGANNHHVAIYQGIPQRIGPLQLSSVHENTEIALADLPGFVRNRVERTMATNSLPAAEAIVADLRTQARPADSDEDDEDGADPGNGNGETDPGDEGSSDDTTEDPEDDEDAAPEQLDASGP
ncbi:PP2C family protein-serine/threonine phosphatase [Pseudactinotalea sp. Z1748]|uniref:PP2C family protein-serine/threonine phosphatase n=1 Tax=Pseudactinotalea sp. Z1748 TaxID=3413027 RepID=UPI003C7CF8E0